jgi:hypothetical protein
MSRDQHCGIRDPLFWEAKSSPLGFVEDYNPYGITLSPGMLFNGYN